MMTSKKLIDGIKHLDTYDGWDVFIDACASAVSEMRDTGDLINAFSTELALVCNAHGLNVIGEGTEIENYYQDVCEKYKD